MTPTAAASDDEGDVQLQYSAELHGAEDNAQDEEEGAAEEEHEQEGAQEDQGPQVPLTPTIQAGTASMQQRKAAIEQQVKGESPWHATF